ncbi:MAG: helix-turn-helix domain-containing protein [Proteobacteria bacterium]|nr:helix-turn-helix domain-containing protein [Pseudomonadota bacterium]
MAQRWLSIVEYARAFNISDMTIRRRIKTGKLSATLKDGKYFIPVSEDAYGRTQESGSSPQPHQSSPTYSYTGRSKSHPSPRSVSSSSERSESYGMAAPGGSARDVAAKPTPSVISSELKSELKSDKKPWEQQPHFQNRDIYSPATSSSSFSSQRGAQLPSTSEIVSSAYQYIPSHITATATPGHSSVDTKALFDMCEDFMSSLAKQAEDLKSSYGNKVLCLEKTLELKDAKIADLNQKIEDLQLLVEIFEGKKPTG